MTPLNLNFEVCLHDICVNMLQNRSVFYSNVCTRARMIQHFTASIIEAMNIAIYDIDILQVVCSK